MEDTIRNSDGNNIAMDDTVVHDGDTVDMVESSEVGSREAHHTPSPSSVSEHQGNLAPISPNTAMTLVIKVEKATCHRAVG